MYITLAGFFPSRPWGASEFAVSHG